VELQSEDLDHTRLVHKVQFKNILHMKPEGISRMNITLTGDLEKNIGPEPILAPSVLHAEHPMTEFQESGNERNEIIAIVDQLPTDSHRSIIDHEEEQ